MPSSTPRAVLHGKLVVVTRPFAENDPLVLALGQCGATVLQRPTVQVRAVSGRQRRAVDDILREALRPPTASALDGVVLTSARGAAFLMERCTQLNLSINRQTPLFVVGPGTAKALPPGFDMLEIATPHTAEGLLQTILNYFDNKLDGKRFLLGLPKGGRDLVLLGLQQAGAVALTAYLYETVAASQGLPLPPAVDWLIFTSPSAVRGFEQLYGGQMPGKIACIGPSTAAAIRHAGKVVSLMPEDHSFDGLVAALCQANTP